MNIKSLPYSLKVLIIITVIFGVSYLSIVGIGRFVIVIDYNYNNCSILNTRSFSVITEKDKNKDSTTCKTYIKYLDNPFGQDVFIIGGIYSIIILPFILLIIYLGITIYECIKERRKETEDWNIQTQNKYNSI